MTPDYEFKVSQQLDGQYHNGRQYYRLDGSQLWVPQSATDRPDREALERHNVHVFLK